MITVCQVVDVDGVVCNRPVRANGYCNTHNVRRRRGTDMNKPIEGPVRDGVNSRCYHCRKIKPYADFHKDSAAVNGVRGVCKLCWNEETRIVNLRRFYKLTFEQLDAMIASQNGQCASCGVEVSRHIPHGYAVDHDHDCCPSHKTCGKCIRSILCKSCNYIEGHLRSASQARALADYIDKWRDRK